MATSSIPLLALGAWILAVGRFVVGRNDPEEEFNGADLTIHKIGATAERETAW